MGKRSKLPAEDREEAVLCLLRKEEPAAAVCRRCGLSVSNRFVYRVLKAASLLQRRPARSAELYQVARLFELLPQRPNNRWQTDVTYVRIPGFGVK